MASATGESSQIDPGKTWVRDRNVTRHPKFNVKDHPINMQGGLTVRNVISSVVDGVNKQSMELYKKKTNSSASGDPIVKLDDDKLIVKLYGKSTEISKFVPLSQPDMNLDEDGSYVLAQYATSRLCHGIGDYFCQTGSDGVNHEDNWDTIFENINRSIDLIHAIQNPPKPKQPIATNKTDEETRFFNSVIKALESSRVDKTTSDAWKSWMKEWYGGGQPLSTRTRIDIREIACDKVAVYGKVRPIVESNKLYTIAENKPVRLKINTDNTITWTKYDNQKVTFGPYKNIVSDDRSNLQLMNCTSINTNTNTNISGKIAEDGAGGLTYDAVRTLASGIDVVLFGFGNSGTGKSFSLFGQPDTSGVPGVDGVDGVLQLILREMKEVKLVNVFEEAPGGEVKDGNLNGGKVDYDGKIINLHGTFTFPDDENTTCEQPKDTTRIIINETAPKYVPNNSVHDISGIINYIDRLVQYRKTKRRIRATLNNWQSSRSHMYILIDVWCGDTSSSSNAKPTARLCVIDLGGMERPDTMLDEMKSKVDQVTDAEDKTTLLRRFNKSDPKKPFSAGLVDTILTLITNITGSARTSHRAELNLDTQPMLLSEWVTGYETIKSVIDDNNLVNHLALLQKLDLLRKKDKKYNIARVMIDEVTCKPFGEQNSMNPLKVMYPYNGAKPIFKPTEDSSTTDTGKYFSLIHVAALYVEGLYIVESLNQVKAYLQNVCVQNQTVLTHRIMKSLTNGKKTRNIMLFTMCPVKLQADQEKFKDKQVFDNDFIEPAQFVQDVCSTVIANEGVKIAL